MKIAVRYYTKTGNTKRLAEALAKELGVKALPVTEPITEPADILFLGNSYYAFSIDPEVRNFVRKAAVVCDFMAAKRLRENR
ncbi:MAG: flavodoxin family protein [Erysipelotrichales bacterium]|nr:flavodoxin family protein [Erysipelotrichales bacterium]